MEELQLVKVFVLDRLFFETFSGVYILSIIIYTHFAYESMLRDTIVFTCCDYFIINQVVGLFLSTYRHGMPDYLQPIL